MTWEPEPAELRDERDRQNAHARRNLEQLKQAVDDGDLELEDLSDENQEKVSDLK